MKPARNHRHVNNWTTVIYGHALDFDDVLQEGDVYEDLQSGRWRPTTAAGQKLMNTACRYVRPVRELQ